MNKYIGIKSAEVAGGAPDNYESVLLLRAESVSKDKIGLKGFLIKLAVCCLFVAAFILLRYSDNPVINNILDVIYRAITFDLIGTDPSDCIVNGWLINLA